MPDLLEYDTTILREIKDPGSQSDLDWGAAMSVALGFLQGNGLVTRGIKPTITEKGEQALQTGSY